MAGIRKDAVGSDIRMSKLLSIIVPAYNEERTIIQVLEAIGNLQLVNGWQKQIIVVDDHSTDSSPELLAEFCKANPTVVHHRQKVNMGKGAAVRKGIEIAGGSYLIFQDADLELDINDINVLLNEVEVNSAKVVYGSRLLTEESKAGFNGLSYAANVFLTGLTNLVCGIKITDMETCYKLIDSKMAKSLNLVEERFGFEPEITAKLAKINGVKFYEVPISYESRNKASGKKIGFTDGVRAIYCILRYGIFK